MATPPRSVDFFQLLLLLLLLLLLNSALPSSFRTSIADASSTDVTQQAIQSLKGGRIVNAAQAKEIFKLKRELVELKGKPWNANANTNDDMDIDVDMDIPAPPKSDIDTHTLETLTRERTDYQFCITELIIHITGEGSEPRPVIDFMKLRNVLEAAREGGWTLRALAEEIEEIAPADQEIIRKGKEKWKGGGSGESVVGREVERRIG